MGGVSLKLLLLSLSASLAGAVAGILLLFATSYAFHGGEVNRTDVLSFFPLMFVPALLMCLLLYAPGLLWLRRKRGAQKKSSPARLFTLTSAFALNIPAFIILLAGLLAGGLFFGASEVLLFAAAFVVAGAVFGRGFASLMLKP